MRNQTDLRDLLLPQSDGGVETSSRFHDIPGTQAVVPKSIKGLPRICEKVYNE